MNELKKNPDNYPDSENHIEKIVPIDSVRRRRANQLMFEVRVDLHNHEEYCH